MREYSDPGPGPGPDPGPDPDPGPGPDPDPDPGPDPDPDPGPGPDPDRLHCTRALWIQIQTQTIFHSILDCNLDSNLDPGPCVRTTVTVLTQHL